MATQKGQVTERCVGLGVNMFLALSLSVIGDTNNADVVFNLHPLVRVIVQQYFEDLCERKRKKSNNICMALIPKHINKCGTSTDPERKSNKAWPRQTTTIHHVNAQSTHFLLLRSRRVGCKSDFSKTAIVLWKLNLDMCLMCRGPNMIVALTLTQHMDLWSISGILDNKSVKNVQRESIYCYLGTRGVVCLLSPAQKHIGCS